MIMNMPKMVASIEAAKEAVKGTRKTEPEEMEALEVEYQVDRPLKN
jgi:hypothetical protein